MAIKKLKSALLKVDEVKTRDITEAEKPLSLLPVGHGILLHLK